MFIFDGVLTLQKYVNDIFQVMVLNSFVIGHELVQKTFKQKETDQCKETEISV